MTTLIAVYSSDGCVGKCDASCYNAKHEKCVCICGGVNHGKGRQQAAQNTRELAESWLKEIEHTKSEMPAKQLSLFEMENE